MIDDRIYPENIQNIDYKDKSLLFLFWNMLPQLWESV